MGTISMTNCCICSSKNIEQVRNYCYCRNCKTWFSIMTKSDYLAKLQKEKAKKQEIGWKIVEEQMKKNKTDRFNWKSIFGMSLTKLIAQMKSRGLNADQVFEEITRKNNLNNELQRRLKIGLSARYGESFNYQQ